MKITTYEAAKKYLEDLIRPSYMQHINGNPNMYQDSLQRMRYLLELLGNPQNTFPSVVVSGTSGKGSTTYLIAHILANAGYKVGMTISPHLTKITERIQITNNKKELKPIDDKTFIKLLNPVSLAIEHMKTTPFGQPSYYEALLAICFLSFSLSKPDIAVIEVGLEGKYDGAQVLNPCAFVYTNTSLDHMQLLGNTVEKIGREGASAIKKYQEKPLQVITGVTQKSVQRIFIKACKRNNANLSLLGRDFSYTLTDMNTNEEVFSFSNKEKKLLNLHCGLVGTYQVTNASLAVETVLQFEQFGFSVTESQIRDVLQTAFFQGRFEKKKNIILDGAHNMAKMRAFLSSLKQLYPKQRKFFLVAFKEDKQIRSMLQCILPIANEIIISEYHATMDWKKKSSAKAKAVADVIASLHYTKPVYVTKNFKEGLKKAKERVNKEDLIIVTGSLYFVGELV